MSILSNTQLLDRLITPDDFKKHLENRGETLDTCQHQPLIIDPYPAPEDIQPASIDVYLDVRSLAEASYRKPGGNDYIIGTDEVNYVPASMTEHEDEDVLRTWVRPGYLYKGRLREWLHIPVSMVGYIHGVSTVARYGLTPHQQAGLLDPGYYGNPTLELSTLLPLEIIVPKSAPYLRIAQISFDSMLVSASPGYSGRYQGLTEASGPILDSK